MATRMQQRRGTAEQWLLADPVLAAGEIGFETDTGSFKIGDSVSPWSVLDYFETSATLAGTIDDYIPLTQKGAANGVAELDENGFVPASQLNIDVSGDIDAAISALVGGAPALLDTIEELSAALGNDENFVTNITNSINAGDASTLTAAEAYADQAEVDAIATANAYTDTRETAITTAYESYADTAEADAVAAAAADATTKANAAQAAAEATAAADATAKASAAETAANTYTDGEISTLDTSLKAYADTAEADAISSANSYTDTEIGAVNTAISNLTTTDISEGANQYYTDTRARNAVSAGDGLDYDSTTGVFSAGIGYGLAIDNNGDISVDGSIIATDQDVNNLIGDITVNGTAGNTITDRIASAVAGIVDSAPTTLDTLNELAAALGDDANFATTVTNQIAGKANTVHTHTLTDVTDITATATELNYVSGVTSSIQTQIDGKANISHTHTTSDITDFAITSPADGSLLKYNSSTSKWEDAIIIDGGNA